MNLLVCADEAWFCEDDGIKELAIENKWWKWWQWIR